LKATAGRKSGKRIEEQKNKGMRGRARGLIRRRQHKGGKTRRSNRGGDELTSRNSGLKGSRRTEVGKKDRFIGS